MSEDANMKQAEAEFAVLKKAFKEYISDNHLSFNELMSTVVLTMAVAEKCSHLTGAQKKVFVVKSIKDMLNESNLSFGNKILIDLFVNYILPAFIDIIVAYHKGNISMVPK